MAITGRKNSDLVISRGDWRLCLCCVVLTRVVLIKSSARSALNIPVENEADLACRVQGLPLHAMQRQALRRDAVVPRLSQASLC